MKEKGNGAFVGDVSGNALKLTVAMAAKHCEHTKNH